MVLQYFFSVKKMPVYVLLLFFVFAFQGERAFAQKTKTITKTQFLAHPFRHDTKLKTFRKKYRWWRFKISDEQVKNRHIKRSDVIHKVKISNSYVFIYQAGKKEIFYKAEIVNKRIKLANGIRKGMKRKAFFSKFSNLKFSKKDKITIRDRDRTEKCTFFFKKNRLVKISIEYAID